MLDLLNSQGRLDRGGYALRLLLTFAGVALLIFVLLNYVGYAWPKAYYQQHHETVEAELEKAKALAAKPVAPAAANATVAPAAGPAAAPAATTPGAAPAAASTPATTTPAVSASAAPAAPAASAPAANTAPSPAPTASTTTAQTAANATVAAAGNATAAPGTPGAPGVATTPPHYASMGGYDRHAFGNVSIFLSIVTCIYGTAVLLTQMVKRLRDAGWHGRGTLFLCVLPVVNVLFALVLLFVPSSSGVDDSSGSHAHH